MMVLIVTIVMMNDDCNAVHCLLLFFYVYIVYAIVHSLLGKPGAHTELQIAVKQYICDWLDRPELIAVDDPDPSTGWCVVGTSNRCADVDPGLCRGGRLEHQIEVLNSQADRACMFASYLASSFGCSHSPSERRPLGLSTDAIQRIADEFSVHTGGYVAADIRALMGEIATIVESESNKQGVTLTITFGEVDPSADCSGVWTMHSLMEVFHRACTSVSPSCLRGITIKIPRLTYDDVIGYSEAKNSLRRILSHAHPAKAHQLKSFGIAATALGGVLLHGPPGNSKTRLAMAAASHHALPMISLSAADVYSVYVGDAEAEIRRAFSIARQAAPCILFLDEMDRYIVDLLPSTRVDVAADDGVH